MDKKEARRKSENCLFPPAMHRFRPTGSIFMLLQNKTILITGAGGGIGEGIARVCHREGAWVVIADIRGDAAQAVAASLGEGAMAVTCDVADDAQMRQLVDATLARFGRIDGLVNNAGVNFAKPFLDTTVDEWARVINVDLRAVFVLTQRVSAQMVNQSPPGGSIVNIASVHSVACYPGSAPYDAAKWGVVGLTKAVAVELAGHGIRVNALSPGLINTQIWRDYLAATPDPDAALNHWKANIPIQRTIEPQEIGEMAAFLLSDRASAITGANLMVDGGMTAQLVSKEPFEMEAIEGK
jgi:NAD(P)-dependent dehydrogenase (short-subunit alcohol dehydrogenase family)